ncbi:hypothetical protein BCON_0180g00190 [Botryotinia convoluta]|uniref:Uncharacterized protein n=1 Tax=Botryotinia convoluta TaxID=54673 RepID=A0A4Z1I0T9_9HELO|nr:hypothetical protein BCON_0180g00190 [Botryotinia convoluta]
MSLMLESLAVREAPKMMAVVIILFLYYTGTLFLMYVAGHKAPLVGLRSYFDHRLTVNYRFFRGAAAIINDGYSKYKNKPWAFARADIDMLVLPQKYVEELRNLPSSVASPTVAHAHNLMGSHTNMDIILRNNLHFRTLVEKLTPNLNSLTRPMQDELEYAVTRDLPDCKGA